MANISTYLDSIMNAIYGEEVRSSIYNAINEMNTQLNAAVLTNLNALGFKGAASGNLDNYNKLSNRGIWVIKPSNSYSNLPSGFDKSIGGLLIIYADEVTVTPEYDDADYVKQELHYYRAGSDSDRDSMGNNVVWSRALVAGDSEFSSGWSDWEKADTTAAMSFEGNLQDGTNLNLLKNASDSGFYKLLSSRTYYNLPSDYTNNTAGLLTVISMGTATIQELRKFSGSGANEITYWARVYASNAWSDWQKNTDNSLSIEGSAADAKAAGQAVLPYGTTVDWDNGPYANVIALPKNKVYGFWGKTGINLPDEEDLNNVTCTLLKFSPYYHDETSEGFAIYILFAWLQNERRMYTAMSSIGATNLEWKKVTQNVNVDSSLTTSGAAADAKAVGDNAVTSKGLAMSTDPQHPVKDLNDYKAPGIYYVGTTRVTNWAFDDNYKGVLVVFNPMTSAAAITDGIVQMAFSNGELAYRMFNGYGTGQVELWSDWIKNDNDRLLNIIESIADVNSVQNEIEATENQNYYLEKTSATTCIVRSSTGTELVLYSVAVEAKKNYRVTASNVASIDNAILAFSTSSLADNVSCTMLIDNTGGPTIDYSYSPTQDGYLFLSKGTNASMTYTIYEIEEQTTLKTDDTLEIEGMPADSKAVGDALVTDKTLTLEDRIADAKAVGDMFDEHTLIERTLLTSADDVDDITDMGLWFVTKVGDDWRPDNWPVNSGGSLVVFRKSNPSVSDPLLRTVQFVLADDIYMRYGLSGSYDWSDWQPFKNYNKLSKIAFLERDLLRGTDDMDDVLSSGIYRVTRNPPADWMPNNWPTTSSGGTILVFRWGSYGDDATLGSFQFALTGSTTYVRWGNSTTEHSWLPWIEYKDYDTIYNAFYSIINNSLANEYSSEQAYKAYDYLIKEGNLYTCLIPAEANEEWVAGKYRRTTIADEVEQVRNAIEISKHNTDLDYYQFPILWVKARTSNGDVVSETGPVTNRRILSDYISRDLIDAVKVTDPFFDVAFALYDSDKVWTSNLSINSDPIALINDEKILFIPEKCGYVRICLVYKPDEAPNTFDIPEMVKDHISGIKFLMSDKYFSEDSVIRTKIPFGIGNFLATGAETFNYNVYRLRTGFIETPKYSGIRITNDNEYQYDVNVRYLNRSFEVQRTDSYSNTNYILLNHYYPYFCLQAYNTTDPNETPLSPEHAIKHIVLESTISGSSGTSTDIVSLNDENNMKVKLQQLSSNLVASSTLPVQPLTLVHFSDLHSNSSAIGRIVEFVDHYSDYIADVIHTGDTVNHIANTFSFGDVEGAEKFLNVVGNHDTWDNTGSTAEYWRTLTEAQTYERYFSPFISNWGSGLNIQQNKCYYYKDYTDNNVRLIAIDCMHESNDQLTWFTSTLSSALSSGLHVIIADHVKMGRSEDLTYLNSGFDNPVFPRSSTPSHPFPNYEVSGYTTALDNFVQSGGFVVAWLCGHMHCDTLATYHNILNIGVTTAGDVAYTRTYDRRIFGTRSYDAFNVMGIDTVRKRLNLVRVGLNYNSLLRNIDTLSWDYHNHTLLHTS